MRNPARVWFVVLCLLPAIAFAAGTDRIWDTQSVDAEGNPTHPKAGAFPDPENMAVVEGIALNASAELLDPDTMWQVYVQGEGDDHGGIAAWAGVWFSPEWPPPYPNVQPGDRVRVTGYLGGHAGKANFGSRHSADPDMQFTVEVLGHPGLRRAIVIPSIADCVGFDMTRETGGERYQAQWCRLRSVHVKSGDWATSSDTLMITDDSGAELNLYLSAMSDFGELPPGGPFNVTGIFDQEDLEAPFTGTYRLWVKSLSDIDTWSHMDVSGDGCVNVADLLIVRNNLGRSGSACDPAIDTNGDGVINVADLLGVRNRLGKGNACP